MSNEKAWNSYNMLTWKAWIDDCIFLKCKTMCDKLVRLKCVSMSLFLYLLNMATIIRVSYPEKSNRVQSRSCHVSLIKLDIVFIKLKINKFSISLLLSWHWWNWFEFILETFVICFAKYHCILDLNATCLVCKACLIHTFSSNKSPCFSSIN